jgi:hypothetical protein
MTPVGAPGVEFVWAKLFNSATSTTAKTIANFLFIAQLKLKRSQRSTRATVHQRSTRLWREARISRQCMNGRKRLNNQY